MPIIAQGFPLEGSSQDGSQNDNHQYHRQYQQQTTRFAPCILLIPASGPQFHIRLTCVRIDIRDVHIDVIQHRPLFVYNMCHIPKQLIELSDTLFDISYLRLSLHNQRFLEINFVLGSQSQLILFLNLRLLLGGAVRVGEVGGVSGFDSSAARRGRGTLLFKSYALNSLELGA